MTGPRNRPAYERSQAIRAAIRAYLLGLHPLARRPTWKVIQAHLAEHRYYLERSAICHHLQQIELEAELELGRTGSAVSPPGEAA